MTHPIDILLVEDNPGDVLLTEEALSASDAGHTLRVFGTGQAALDELEQNILTGELPDLVLLDLNLPGMSGHDVLATIKGNPQLDELPVVMMTTSTADADVRRSYKLHASSYVAKPIELDGYLAAVSAIESFWSDVARLPRRARPGSDR